MISNQRVSIITVTYNAADTIRETIQSTCDQTYPFIERIVIDGGSADRTLEIVEEFQDRISYLSSEKDNGIYDAMNKGIAKATGEWLIFMNSGDSFSDKYVLQNIFRSEIPSGTEIIYGNTIVANDASMIKPPYSVTKDFFFFETLCHQSVLFARTAFGKVGGFDTGYKIVSDREWLLRARMIGLDFHYVDVTISKWNREGFSTENASISHHENRLIQHRYFGLLERVILPWMMRFKNISRKIGLASAK